MHNFLPWTASCCVLMWLTGGIAAFAQSGQSLVEKVRGNAEFLRFVGSLNLNGCIEDVPAPDLLAEQLYTADWPDPDLLVRTSGEMRISNFLLWQIAYAELYVTPVLWPDFGREGLFAAVLDYQRRERRFGGVTA